MKNGKAGESLSIRLIPNHDRDEENIRFAKVDFARATMTSPLVSSLFPREANRVVGGRRVSGRGLWKRCRSQDHEFSFIHSKDIHFGSDVVELISDESIQELN